ncbi:hypothetical protein BP6252_10629 [Coleophoma cylindrospora]|uniref:Uncharacterized protein n=1 Tax=Coleophoma cylindrospora TaxID=1849047 RepID=A0A3D8QTG4_9HELO|nr:hypothetical protein BP6252_10629 [Coleophoma cylindrospora]
MPAFTSPPRSPTRTPPRKYLIECHPLFSPTTSSNLDSEIDHFAESWRLPCSLDDEMPASPGSPGSLCSRRSSLGTLYEEEEDAELGVVIQPRTTKTFEVTRARSGANA